jgi:hypothetical protein
MSGFSYKTIELRDKQNNDLIMNQNVANIQYICDIIYFKMIWKVLMIK